MVNHLFVSEHTEEVKHLIKTGYLSNKILVDFEIYKTYLAKGEAKMCAYESTAQDHDCSIRTVMSSVKSMERDIPFARTTANK